jgi:hypothetical protein
MPSSDERTRQVIETGIRLGTIALIAWICLAILRPFVMPVAWGLIIAVAIFPLHTKLVSALGGRSRLAVGLFAVIGLAVLIVPRADGAADDLIGRGDAACARRVRSWDTARATAARPRRRVAGGR